MREVVGQVQDAGFVLKGGGALVLVYGSIRHTTDLDFDAHRPTDMTRRIRRAARSAEVEIDPKTWWWPKSLLQKSDGSRDPPIGSGMPAKWRNSGLQRAQQPMLEPFRRPQ